MFSAGHPAFQKTSLPKTPGGPPSFLDSMDGNVTTAWVQLVTRAGSYISQPQDSPLFDQPSTQAAAGALNVHLLDFLPLPTWSAANSALAAGAGAATTPLVPMAPFSGLQFNDPEQAKPYTDIETTALNPTRKNRFTSVKATVSARRRALGDALAAAPEAALTYAMTPQGLLAGLSGAAPQQLWETTRIAISPPLKPAGQSAVPLGDRSDQYRRLAIQSDACGHAAEGHEAGNAANRADEVLSGPVDPGTGRGHEPVVAGRYVQRARAGVLPERRPDIHPKPDSGSLRGGLRQLPRRRANWA